MTVNFHARFVRMGRVVAGFMLGLALVPAQAADFTLVQAGRVLPVPGEAVLEERTIVIRDGDVLQIAEGYLDASNFEADEEDTVTVVDWRALFVLPGLIDGHVHMTNELGPRRKLSRVEQSSAEVAFETAEFAKRTLMAGFTTARDLGAATGGDAIFATRDAIAKGIIPGPRLFAAGHTITPSGGHGQPQGYRPDVQHLMQTTGICDGVADCRKAVRTQVMRGADQIKLTSTGGVLSETAAGTEQQFFADELKAIVETGHQLGRRVTAHAHGTVGINAALDAGVDAIEHGTFADESSFRLFKRTGAFLVPTILAGVTVAEMAVPDDTFMAPPIRAKALAVGPQMLDMVRRAHGAGVRIAFGTDSGVSRHGENAREFLLLAEAGLTAEEAIITATVNGAENLGQSEYLGTLEPGKAGDLIAVEGSPLEDLSELMDVDGVIKAGVVYKSL